jgi:hypothetical protein
MVMFYILNYSLEYIVQKYWPDDDTVVSKHVVKLKVEIIKAYGVVCMTEVLKSK